MLLVYFFFELRVYFYPTCLVSILVLDYLSSDFKSLKRAPPYDLVTVFWPLNELRVKEPREVLILLGYSY